MLFNMEITHCTPIWAPQNIPFCLREMEISPQDKIEKTEKKFIVKPYLIYFATKIRVAFPKGLRRACGVWCAGLLCWVSQQNNTPAHKHTSIQHYQFTRSPAYKYTSTPAHQQPAHRHTSTSAHQNSSIPAHQPSSSSAHKHAAHQHTSTQAEQHTGKQAQQHTSTTISKNNND